MQKRIVVIVALCVISSWSIDAKFKKNKQCKNNKCAQVMKQKEKHVCPCDENCKCDPCLCPKQLPQAVSNADQSCGNITC